jgi:hypothetical protein
MARPAPQPATLEAQAAYRNVSEPRDHRLSFVPPEETPFLLARTSVSVTNDDKKTVILAWDGQRWELRPSETAIVPFQAVVNALGDPRSMRGEIIRFTDEHGRRGFVPERYEELQRLFPLYGVRNENIDTESARAHEMADRPLSEACSLTQRVPVLSVKTTRGIPIVFPSQQPDMLPYPVRETAGRGRGHVDQRKAMDQVAAENADLKSRIEKMEALLNSQLGGGPTNDSGTPVPD